MSIQHFTNGSRFCWQEASYEVVRLLPEQKLSIENLLAGARLVVEMSVLVMALFNGELEFTNHSQPVNKDEPGHRGVRGEYIDLSDCPEDWVALAKYRLEAIRPLLLGKRTHTVVEARVKQLKNDGLTSDLGTASAVSIASIYRWLRDYTNSGGDLRALIFADDKRGGKGKSRLTEEVEAMIDRVIQDKYYVRENVTIKDLRDELANTDYRREPPPATEPASGNAIGINDHSPLTCRGAIQEDGGQAWSADSQASVGPVWADRLSDPTVRTSGDRPHQIRSDRD